MKGRVISENKNKITPPTLKPKKGKYDKLVGEITSSKTVETAAENVPVELQTKDDEKKELKLLEYQLKNKDMTVNQFLLDKYTEGNFNTATRDGYDNSKKRIEAGVEYEYHVYFPYDKENDAKRPPNFLISTDEIVDFHTNDSYFYHFAIFENDSATYKLDYTGETINKNGVKVVGEKKLFSALQILAEHVKNDNPRFNDVEYVQLQQEGFITKDGQMKLDISGMLVSKYFKGFKNEKKNIGLEYLNNVGVKDDVKATPVKPKKNKTKDLHFSLVATKSTTFPTNGADLSDESKLIAYCHSNHIVVKVIEQLGGTRATEQIPFFLKRDDTLYLLFLRFNRGDRQTMINELINIANKIIVAQYNQLKSGYFQNAREVSLLDRFLNDKSYKTFLENYSKGKINGFKEYTL